MSETPEFRWRVTMFDDEDDVSIEPGFELSSLGPERLLSVLGNSFIMLGAKLMQASFDNNEDEESTEETLQSLELDWDME